MYRKNSRGRISRRAKILESSRA